MNSIHEKEKKLQQALEKLNLINPQNLNLKEKKIPKEIKFLMTQSYWKR